jgi:glycosyltransferase involved in cell wall biosynthesis
MTVTLIIINYNKGPYVREAIDSALNQDYSDYEILIIDDGSTDGSTEIIQEYEVNYEDIHVIFQENKGVISTRNIAIMAAKGEFIVQLDGDDKLDENFLKWTVPVLKENENVGIVFCKTCLFGARSGNWNRGEYSIKRQLTANLIVITALFRKSDYLRTHGYRDEFKEGLEDWDFWLSIIELGKEVREVNEIGFNYRILEDSRNSSYSLVVHQKLKQQIFEFHSELYLINGLNPVKLLWDIRVQESINNDLSIKVRSLEYRLGNLLLKPFRVIQKLLKQ